MSENAMAGAVTLCGVGLCTIGGALLMQNGQQAYAAGVPAAAAMVASAANAQAGPTVVWYGVVQNPRFRHLYNAGEQVFTDSYEYSVLFRAWSDGTIEAKKICVGSSCSAGISGGGWSVVNSPSAGYRAAADANADEIVDGVDLGLVLGNWGDAPRVPFPPSDCPLNLINP